uniref:Uncharacterized protein n=1 Tax=Cacopsylla melanoneura TaxID=428564 RepID=A0A8D8RAC9_9HEMI
MLEAKHINKHYSSGGRFKGSVGLTINYYSHYLFPSYGNLIYFFLQKGCCAPELVSHYLLHLCLMPFPKRKNSVGFEPPTFGSVHNQGSRPRPIEFLISKHAAIFGRYIL